MATLVSRGYDADAETMLSNAVAAGTLVKLCDGGDAVIHRHTDASGVLAAMGLDVWMPFAVNEALIGGFGLGAKLTEESYTDEDCELLATLAARA